MKKFAKRFTLAFLAGILMALGAVLGACGGKDPEPSEEQGLYYYDAGTEEYTLELILGNTFTLEMKGKEMTGKYELDGELLTLKVKKGDELSANYYENAVTLTYEEATYRFLKKIDYTVTFQTNGGTAVDAQKVVNGKTVAKPDDPANGDLVFVGWYTDNNTFRNLFSFTQPITADITLYARFVEKIQPEFTVKFDAGEGATTVDPMTTVGHKLFGLPTPQKAGAQFVGWWMSDYNDAEKLTAQYVEQSIEQPITLFAVWESDAPAVSVSSTGVVWTGRSGNTNYTVTITDPDGNAVVNGLNVGTTSYPYNFANAAEGDYTVSVTMNGQTTTAYYKNKALASVSYFEVEGNTLLFNAVPNATNYLITVVCGTETHTHTDLDLGTKTSFDFSECAMKDGKIVFTVKATAKGYVPSTSRSYECTRTLDVVTGLSFDAEKDVVSWAAVKNAASYNVKVLHNGDEVGNVTVTDTRCDLQFYNMGATTVEVTPVAFGWNSPASVSGNYTKNHIATPSDVRLVASLLQWNEVEGATGGYIVDLDGTPYPVQDNTFDLTSYYDASKETYTVKVCAIAANPKNSSLWAPNYVIRNGEMGALRYQASYVEWDAVFGVDSYYVKVNDGAQQLIEGATKEYIVFDREGVNTIYVCAVNADGTSSAWVSIDIDVYSIQFDAQSGADVPTLYKAKGDPLTLVPSTRTGYSFSGWYTEPNGGGDAFAPETFEFEYNRTLYAKWTPNVYTVTFNVGEYADGEVEEAKVTFGEPLQLATPKSNSVIYAFGGWYDNAGKQYTDYQGKGFGENATYLNPGNMELKARWVEIFEFDENVNGSVTVSKGEGIRYVSEVEVPATYTKDGKVYNVDTLADFSNTPTLTKIRIPSTIQTITFANDNAAFMGCDALTDIEIYHSDVELDQKYFSADGVLFYWNAVAGGGRMEIRCYPYGRTATEYTIPGTIETPDGIKNVTAIATGSFIAASSYRTNGKLTTLNIPATVSVIEQKAFKFYTDLKTINFLPLKEGETQAQDLDLRENAFGDPQDKSTSAVSPIAYIKLPKYLESDPVKALNGLTRLTYVEVEEGGTYTSLDGLLCKQGTYGGYELLLYPVNRSIDENGEYVKDYALGEYERTFTIPGEIFSVGSNAVKNNTHLRTIVVPGHVRYIGKGAFLGLTSLMTITFEGDENSDPLVLDDEAFLAARRTKEGQSLADWNNVMTTLTLPANLQKLGTHAFGGYTKLTTVTVKYALQDEIDYAKDAFDAGESGNIFSRSKVTTVHFTDTVPYFEVLNVFGPNLETLDIPVTNPYYATDEQGIVYNATFDQLVLFPANFSGAYTIPDKVTKIQSGMFKERPGLNSIIIPATVTEIGNQAFYKCTGLNTVTFLPPAEGTERAALTIGDSAFSGCKALDELSLPEGLTAIGEKAFEGCTELTEIVLPKSLETLTMNSVYHNLQVFSGCTKLTSISVAAGSEHFAFDNGVLYTLREAKLNPKDPEPTYVPDKVIYVTTSTNGNITVSPYISSIGPLAFTRTSQTEAEKLGIKTIRFEDHIDTYDPETGDVQFTEINFGEYDTYQGTSDSETYTSMFSPFYYLEDLTEVHLPEGLVQIPRGLFSHCTGLLKVNIPSTVTLIRKHAFYYSTNLTTLTFDDGGTEPLVIEDCTKVSASLVQYTGYSTFGGMKDLKTIEFPDRIAKLGSYTFYTSSTSSGGLETVTFPSELKGTLEMGTNVFANNKNLTSVTLPKKGLTVISANAFLGTGLTSIDLTGITTIGDGAFSGVTSLTGTLTIPACVTSIGKNAFSGTNFSKIETVDGNLLETIGDSAFASNPTLTSVVFGKTETPLTFGASVFTGATKLQSFEFPQNVKEIGASIFLNLTNLTSITFANGTSLLESIGDTAFSKTGITSITFPESSAQLGIDLGSNLFKSCPYFTTMNLSVSVRALDGVLGGCGTIDTINVPAENPYLEADDELPIIYQKLDGGERSVVLIYRELSGESEHFTIAGGAAIGERAFANQPQLKYVFIPASVRTIGAFAFQNCVNLETVKFENGSLLQSIGEGAFQNCFKLKSINLEVATNLTTLEDGTGDDSNYTSLDGEKIYIYTSTGIFAGAGRDSEEPLKIKFPATAAVTKLGAFMFMTSGAAEIDLSGLTSVKDIPKAPYSSDHYGFFSQNPNLTTVKLPNSIEFLGMYSFKDCTALKEIDLTNLTKLVYMTDSKKTSMPTSATTAVGMFENCSALTTVKFPTSLELLGAKCFDGCTKLTTITGLDNVTMIGTYAFAGTGFTNIDLDAMLPKLNTAKFSSVNYTFANCAALQTVDLSMFYTLATLPTNMFQNCTSLQTMDLSEFTALTALPNYMFDGCSNLASVTLPTGDKLAHLGTYTFRNCTALKKINSNVEGTFDFSGLTALTRFSAGAKTNVGSNTSGASYLFQGCTSLQNVIFPTGFEQIGGFTFQGCTGLESIDLTNITKIGYNAFNASGLTSVTIPATCANIYEAAFSDCANLETVTFGNGTGTIALTAGGTSFTSSTRKPGVFENSGVTTINFGTGIKTLTACTFRGCYNLTEVKLPESLTGTMGTYVFDSCTNLESVDLTEFTKALGNYSFLNCTNLTEVKFGTGTLGTNAFEGCTNLERVDLSETGLTSLSGYLFKDCTKLTEVMLPAGLTSFGAGVFQGCISLQEIDLSKTQVTNLSTSATGNGSTKSYLFDGCTALTTVTTTEGQITVIGAYAFRGCESLETFDLTAVTDLGGGAFENAGLTGTVTLPAGLASFRADSGIYPFAGCSKITEFEVEGGNTALSQMSGILLLSDGTIVAVPGGFAPEGGVLDLNAYAEEGTELKFSGYMFDGVSNITKVILPANVTTLPDYMFANSGIQEVELPTSLTAIPKHMFDGSGITKIEIPASVTSIGENAFANTYALDSVTFLPASDGTTELPLTIGGAVTAATGTTGAFYQSAVKNVVFPERLSEVPAGIFMYATGLENIVFPASIIEIPKHCFYGATLTKLFITENIERIATYAYSHAQGLTKLTAEDFKQIKGLGEHAFDYSSVTEVTIPGTVIGGNYTASTGVYNVSVLYIFQHCQNLVRVEFEDSAEGVTRGITVNQLFEDTPKLTTVVFGDGVKTLSTTLWGRAGTSALKTLVLADSVTSIGSGSLQNCTGIEKLVIGKNSQLTSLDAMAFSTWTENTTICFENSQYIVGSLVGLDWMANTKAKVVFNYDPAAEQPAPEAQA